MEMEIITPQSYNNNAGKPKPKPKPQRRACSACRNRKTRCETKASNRGCVGCRQRSTVCDFQHDPPEGQATASASSNGTYIGKESGGGWLYDSPGLGLGPGPGVGGPGSIGIRQDHHAPPSVTLPELMEPGTLPQILGYSLSYFNKSGLGSDIEPTTIPWPDDHSLKTHAICYDESQPATFHLPPDEKAVESDPTQLLADSVEGPSTINSALPNVLFIGTGGTIAGVNRLHEPATEYTSGVLGIDRLLKDSPQLLDICNVWYKQVANIDSVNINSTILWRILSAVQHGLDTPKYAGVVILHGTDTLEETAEFVDLTTFSDKPVVLTGAVRPSTDPSPDGPMNILGSAVVASSANSKNRGALCVFNNQIHSTSMIRKKDFNNIDAFTSKSPLGTVHNNIARFFFRASRPTDHHYFSVNGNMTLPRIEMLSAYQGRIEDDLTDLIRKGFHGLVLEGFGGGYWPEGPITRSSAVAARYNFPVVIASRTICGFVAGRYGFMGAGDLSPWQARVKLQLAIATGRDPRIFFAK